MFFASNSLKRHQYMYVLFDRYSPTPYHYARHLPQSKASTRSLAHLVKARG